MVIIYDGNFEYVANVWRQWDFSKNKYKIFTVVDLTSQIDLFIQHVWTKFWVTFKCKNIWDRILVQEIVFRVCFRYSEIGAYVSSNLCSLNCVRHLIRAGAVKKTFIIYTYQCIFLGLKMVEIEAKEKGMERKQ